MYLGCCLTSYRCMHLVRILQVSSAYRGVRQRLAQQDMTNHSLPYSSTAQHGKCSTAQHSQTQHTAIQNGLETCITAQHSTAQHSTAQHNPVQHITTQYIAWSGITQKGVRWTDPDSRPAQQPIEVISHPEPEAIKGVVVRHPHTQPIQSLLHMLLSPAHTHTCLHSPGHPAGGS